MAFSRRFKFRGQKQNVLHVFHVSRAWCEKTRQHLVWSHQWRIHLYNGWSNRHNILTCEFCINKKIQSLRLTSGLQNFGFHSYHQNTRNYILRGLLRRILGYKNFWYPGSLFKPLWPENCHLVLWLWTVDSGVGDIVMMPTECRPNSWILLPEFGCYWHLLNVRARR